MNKMIFKIFVIALAVFSLSLIQGCGKKPVNTKPKVTIITEPAGVTVSIGEKQLGITSAEKPLVLNVPPGVYILKFSKINYVMTWEKLICTQQPQQTLNVKLPKITASVMIRSNPAGAEVNFNGEVVGETPMTLHDQPIGKYTAILKKQGYTNVEINWEVPDPRPQVVNASLISNMGNLSIASNPSNCSIFIDEKPRGPTPFEGSIEQGSHKIRIEKEGYTPIEEVMIVKKNEKSTKSYTLQMKPGAITVKSTPSGASVFLNNQLYGNTPVEIKELVPGTYQIRVEKAGCDPLIKQISIAAGRSAEEAVQLSSNTGGIDLVVNPPGVTVYLDGKKIGVSEPDEEKNSLEENKKLHLKFSKVISLRGISADEHILKFIHKRAQPEEKTLKIKVKKGEIERPKTVVMWVATATLSLKNGRVMNGILAGENKEEILFEPEPGVRQGYKRNEIQSLIMLKQEE